MMSLLKEEDIGGSPRGDGLGLWGLLGLEELRAFLRRSRDGANASRARRRLASAPTHIRAHQDRQKASQLGLLSGLRGGQYVPSDLLLVSRGLKSVSASCGLFGEPWAPGTALLPAPVRTTLRITWTQPGRGNVAREAVQRQPQSAC